MTTEERIELLERKVAKLESLTGVLNDMLASHGYSEDEDRKYNEK